MNMMTKPQSRYDILFEPIAIGPVTAPNRFYQVPHASGMTNALPRIRAKFRETKAEGGWGVVCTGACSIDLSSDDSPLPMATMWDDNDIKSHALMTEAVHRHGSLAGVELWHGGASVMNRTTRVAPLSPSGIPWMATHVGFMGNLRPKTMDKQDIRDVLRWQAEGARKARIAGFDIVYVYAGMGYLGYEFLLPEYNHRIDEYGGSIENRVRFVREMIEVTKDAVGRDCGVALRISLEELRAKIGKHHPSEAHEVIELLSEIPDLFDVKMDSSPTDCSASRFTGEGSHEPVIEFVKKLTKKPVVGVGRFTSPDAMVSQIKRGVLDIIGGARPSIADPFLPNKIRENRIEEIRECIGCNICISSWHDGVPVRCTQNPTIGEEWRRGWHPENPGRADISERVLVIGGGPAGLEAALTLGRRGHQVTLADKASAYGGRLNFEKTLPGLSAWNRVVDYRLGRLREMTNVEMYLESELGVDEIIDLAPDHVLVASGARWTNFLYSSMEIPVGQLEHERVFTPDDIAAGRLPEGPTVVFDFDNYYMGGVITEHLAAQGVPVSYATPAGQASAWTIMTNELPLVARALTRRNVPVRTLETISGFDGETVTLAQLFTGEKTELQCRNVVITGLRLPRTELFDAMAARRADLEAAGIKSFELAGDALAPGALAHAVHSGHRAAQELGKGPQPFRRDAPIVEFEPSYTSEKGLLEERNEGKPMASEAPSISPWSIASPLAGGAIHAMGSGLFHTLIPLRLVAEGYGPNTIGLVIGAEGAGFLIGCIGSTRLIRSVGEVRAYAALSAVSAVLIMAWGFSPHLAILMLIQAAIGFANAGQAVVIESWMNAMVSNANRGRVLTLYVLVLGLFYGLGQLLATDIDPGGLPLLMIAASLYTIALVPVTAVWVGEPQLHVDVGIRIFRALRTSPTGALACLLTGLISSTFASIGPLYGLDLGFGQGQIVIMMAATQLGALFLQFPLGYLSDRLDRRAMMFWLSLVLAALCGAMVFLHAGLPFWIFIVAFSLFGGLTEIFYPLGVAHANDKADPQEFVTLSSNLLLIWAFGGTIGPAAITLGVEPFGAEIFFYYAIALSVLFAGFALWRRYRQPKSKSREQFVAYPQTSPQVYEWAPHTPAGDDNDPPNPDPEENKP